MKQFIGYNGKVVEVESICGYYNRTMSVELKDGTRISGINTIYHCDRNGKSLSTNEYLNWNDDFFPYENGIFKSERLKKNERN